MNISQQRFSLKLLLLMLFFLTIFSTKPTYQKPLLDLDQNVCNLDVMRSYLLKGKRFSDQKRKSLICPTLTSTCCSRFDEQRAYLTIKQVLPGRLYEYREKFKGALLRIKKLQQFITARRIEGRGTIERRQFCGAEYRKLEAFKFNEFYEKVIQEHLETEIDLMHHYSAFYCILCDGKNHRNFFTRGNSTRVIVDSRFCYTLLSENKDLIEWLNVDLVNLLITLQNVVDCHHYRTSFNLGFFHQAKFHQVAETGQCITALGGTNFMSRCQRVCNRINFASVMDLMEGDFEFVNIALNLFEKYIRHREVQTFVSNDLRAFFKTLLMRNPTEEEDTDSERVFQDLPEVTDARERRLDMNYDKPQMQEIFENEPKGQKKKKVSKIILAKKMLKKRNLKKKQKLRNKKLKTAKHFSTPKNVQLFSAKRPIERKLQEGETPRTEMSMPPLNELNTNVSLKRGHFSKSKRYRTKIASIVTPALVKNFPKPKIGPLIFAKELKEAYERIFIDEKNLSMKTVFEVQIQPINIDRAGRLYDSENGLDTTKYVLGFDTPERIFYKNLFSYRKPEKIDTEAYIFLEEFTLEYKEKKIKQCMANYRINAKDWEIWYSKFEPELKKTSYLLRE